jgi:HSP20 family protein
MPYRKRQAWMWMEACEMLSQADRLHQQFFRPGQAAWEPPVDLIQNDAEVYLVVALPGVAPENVKLRLDGNGIFIEAARPRGMTVPGAGPPGLNSGGVTIHTLEIPYGRFARRVLLPPGTYELKEKFFRDGCLSLHLFRHA